MPAANTTNVGCCIFAHFNNAAKVSGRYLKMDIETEKNLLQFLPPPIDAWKHVLFEKAGITVDVLRLDLMHPVMGGNKWIKLKGFLEQVITSGKAGILTKGGPWSNHIHACAWMCRELGITCHIWVKGHSGITSLMLEDVVNWDARILFVNRAEFYNDEKAIDFAENNNLLYVPMGGAEETGMQQVTQYIQGLHLPHYDFALCAVGTATTFGGVAFVPDNFNHLLGIDAGTADNAVKQKMIYWQQSLPDKTLSLITEYDFGGFARHTPALVTFINELFISHQLPTDIVYTGKLFYATLDLALKRFFPAGAKLLVMHSGGLQGNRSLPPGTLEF